MKYLLFITIFLIYFSNLTKSQVPVSKEKGFAILESKKNIFPKFYNELFNLLKSDRRIKEIKFVRGKRGQTVGKASKGEGSITFDLYSFENPDPDHDDNRMLVILYHELGHLYDDIGTNKAEREEQAFRYSIKRLRKLAEQGDCEPLSIALKYMKQRSKKNNLSNPHVIGLKDFVQSKLFLDSEKYVSNNCKESADILF